MAKKLLILVLSLFAFKLRAALISIVVIALSSWAGSMALAVVEKNLLKNPQFEGGVTGVLPEDWSKGDYWGKRMDDRFFEVDDRVSHSGEKSLKLMSDRGDVPTVIDSETIDVKPGERFLLSAYFKGVADTDPVECKVYFLSTDYRMAVSKSVFIKEPWRPFLLAATVTDQQKSNKMRVRFELHDKGSVWIDDVALTRIDPHADLSKLDSPSLGYRYRPGPGGDNVLLEVGSHGVGAFLNINGVFGYDPLLKDLRLKVVRIWNVLTRFNILHKDAEGRLSYRWEMLDRAIDDVLSTGAVPEMSLCFTPVALVDHPDPKKIRGSMYLGPPTNMEKWEAYLTALVEHCRTRYDISGWYWVFGNEPGYPQFSMGTEEEFFALYRHTASALIRVDPKIIIGAGGFAHMGWLYRFIERCGREGTPISLLSWHEYGMLPENYLYTIERVRKWASRYPNTRGAKLAIDEWNPKLPDSGTPLSGNQYTAAQQAATIKYMQDGGLSFNVFFRTRTPGLRNGLIQSESVVRNTTFNVYEMFARMGSTALPVKVPEDEPYVGALAARDHAGVVSVMVWNAKYDYDLHANMTKTVTVRLGEGYKDAAIRMFLIDDTLSNGYNDPSHQMLETFSAFDKRGANIRFALKSNSVALIQATPAIEGAALKPMGVNVAGIKEK